ncbi:MAG TPA: ATP-binding protein [Polyangiaceae bacterium]|nr:ATP-binding protein [Polyangiaceae bacterium]
MNHTTGQNGAQRRPCDCSAPHTPRLVVLTGGPGAGKTAVLEMVRRHFCEHVVVLQESASILFGGGFPRLAVAAAERAAQRAIFHVQHELEAVALADPRAAVILCDRGTLDGLAYWPGEPATFFSDLGTTHEAELRRYAAVIHLHTPTVSGGYDHTNPLRVESARLAHSIDLKIGNVWKTHPHYRTVGNASDFVTKAHRAIEAIAAEVPECCRVKET